MTIHVHLIKNIAKSVVKPLYRYKYFDSIVLWIIYHTYRIKHNSIFQHIFPLTQETTLDWAELVHQGPAIEDTF